MTQAKFQAGDRVRALKDYSPGRQFTRGREYVVTGQEGTMVSVDRDDKGSRTNGLRAEFFELVAPEPRPASPKYRPGDQVTLTGEVESNDDGYVVIRTAVQNSRVAAFESELDPYGVPFDVVAVPDAPFRPGDRVCFKQYPEVTGEVLDVDLGRPRTDSVLVRWSGGSGWSYPDLMRRVAPRLFGSENGQTWYEIEPGNSLNEYPPYLRIEH